PLLKSERCAHREDISPGRLDEFRTSPVDLRAEDLKRDTQIITTRAAPFALPTTQAGRDIDSVAHRKGCHLCADLLHYAGYIAAGNVGQRERIAWNALPDPNVQVIQGAGLDPEQHLVLFVYRIMPDCTTQQIRPT